MRVALVALAALVASCSSDPDAAQGADTTSTTTPTTTTSTTTSATDDDPAVADDPGTTTSSSPATGSSPPCAVGEWDAVHESLRDALAARPAGSIPMTVEESQGTVSLGIAGDGTATVTYDTWLVTARVTEPTAPVSITRTGTDRGSWAPAGDDVSIRLGTGGAQVVASMTVDGQTMLLTDGESLDTDVLVDATSATCTGDRLVVNGTGPPVLFDRAG